MTTLHATTPLSNVSNIIDEYGHIHAQIYGPPDYTPEQVLELARVMAAGPGLVEALRLILDQVDYTNGACGVTEMVGAVLPTVVIERARAALSAAGVAP